MDDCRRFEGITPEKLAKLKETLEKGGIKVPEGGNGIIAAMGVKVSVSYVEAENVLTICILDKPAFIPSSLVWSQVEGPLRNI